MCLGIQKPDAIAINAFSLGTTMTSTYSTFQSCRLNISDDLQRQDKRTSCTRLVNPSLKNRTLPHKTSKYHLLCKKKKLQLIGIRVIILSKKTLCTLQV